MIRAMPAPPASVSFWPNAAQPTSATSAVLAAAAGRWAQAVPAATAVALLMLWLMLYAQISKPINLQLRAAAAACGTRRSLDREIGATKQ